eukprot:CAMPEP_0196729724 /NCGR_PEP_ID=MMETSP1091-20130531/10020_1 /TAXON_ID=302021 /ORGANISM="Rhodomonas sp., Strain CCMP768" /LENGTH=207 /DNA_ID=CAMNT_0042072641 /DNA_START=109 /DNA_END=732 /DNA_ORIENTATION=-
MAASTPASGLVSSKAPGMLISQKGPRGWRLGFVAAAPSALNRAPARSVSSRKLRLASAKMALSGAHLVTYGDVWRDAIEGQSSEGLASGLAEAGMEEADMEIEDFVAPLTTAASSFASRIWQSLIDEPTPEEVQANMAAFARAHSGAVATPLSEDELESEVKYCAMIPELRDALVDAEVMQQELQDAILHRQLADKIKSFSKRESVL